MVCVGNWVEHSKHPTWSRVGMEITPDELRKVLESQEYKPSLLAAVPDVGYILVVLVILVLGVASVVVFMIYQQFNKRKQAQVNGGVQRCQGDIQKLYQGFELQDQVLSKIESMDHRLVTLEEFLSCLMDRRNKKAEGEKRGAVWFPDYSD